MKFFILLAVVLPACLGAPEHRIVGGATASNGQFKHQISMQVNGQHSCGGSIISSNVILTAAHCVYGQTAAGMSVVAGTNIWNQGGVRVSVNSFVIHPQYNPNSLVNDIALLYLAGSLPIGGNIQTIQLRQNGVNPGETLTLSGWGLTSYPGNTPYNLQWIRMGAIDVNTCASRLTGYSPITTGHVCTSSPVNQGACMGDSGGPLIDASGVQIGVVSWGVPCAKGLPDVFTSVPFYLNWILGNTKTVELV